MVGRNPLRIVIAEGEANIFEGAFKTIDARFVLHPGVIALSQTSFRAFPVEVVIAFHPFFYLICAYRASPLLSEACIRPPIYISSVLSQVTFPLLS